MSDKFKDQGDIILENIDMILQDIKKNANRLCSPEAVGGTIDYGNIAKFKLGNFISVEPKYKNTMICYSIHVATMFIR